MDIERWRPITGIEGNYHVSSWGRVRNGHTKRILASHVQGKCRTIILKGNGNGKGKGFSLPRLVLSIFHPIPYMDQYFAAYKDSDPTNNRLDNLEWRYKGAFFSHLTEQDVRDIRARWQATGETYRSIGKDYDLGPNSIGAIIRGEYWGIVS